jgi:kynurenine formamidase
MKIRHCLFVSLLTVFLIISISGIALSEEKAPCPDNRPTNWISNWGKWGPDDEAGTLNYITPAVMKNAAKLIKQGKVISLAMNATPRVSPAWPGRHGLIRNLNATGADNHMRKGRGTLAGTDSDLTIEDHGSTHLDPLVHVYWGDCTYNNYFAPDVITPAGVIKGSTNAYIPKSFTKGVLIDVAKYLGVDYVEKIDGGTEVTPELIDKIAAAQGVEITPGTAVLIRTGWMKKWTGVKKPWAIGDSHVGISCSSVKWLQEKKVSLVGADNVGLEAIPTNKECDDFYKVPILPMHIGILSMLGMPMIELMDLDEIAADSANDGVYEFAFSFSPFRYFNASGGLVSPTAIK